MGTKRPPIEYRAERPPTRTWGLSRPVWGLVSGGCAVVDLGGELATNGRLNGWADLAFVVAVATLGLVAFANAVRPARRGRGG